MSVVLFVRVGSDLERQELERRALERRPNFLGVPGLIQKIYGRDPETGDWCGIYFFESSEALKNFRESDLAKSIPDAYEATDVRREIFEVMYPLRPDVGPVNG
jgi:Putative mono-oxygenase ydhR